MDNFLYLSQPCLSLLGCTGDYGSKISPVNFCYAAQTKNALDPVGLERVAIKLLFDVLWCVCGIEDQSYTGFEQTDRFCSSCTIRDEIVCAASSEHAVNPSTQNCRWRTPPVRMHNHDPVGLTNLAAMLLDCGRQLGVFAQFSLCEHGVEIFRVQVVEVRLVTVGVECGQNGLCNCMIETSGRRMRQNYRHRHDNQKCPMQSCKCKFNCVSLTPGLLEAGLQVWVAQRTQNPRILSG